MTIGRLITPTLKLIRELGEGGMGKVWAAENLALGSLDEWMKKALAVDLEKRFESASKMAQALKKAITSSTIESKITPSSENRDVFTSAPTVNAHRQTYASSPNDDTTQVDAPLHQRVAHSADTDMRFFEGAWFSAPFGGHYYVRIIRGQLRVAYCYHGNDQLSGEYYDCQVTERSLFARFRWPQTPHLHGYIAMHATSHDTLVGGWWSESKVPPNIASDLSKLSDDIPGQHASAWRRLPPRRRFPDWAEAYFAKAKALAIVAR